MRDPIIREAVHKKILRKHHEDKNTVVLDEFGINHGAIRADIAVLNGMLHGYEIKGSADKLDRLPAQAEAYSSVFDKVTLVVSEKHLDAALKIVPKWWGIYLIYSGKSEKPQFRLHRKASRNQSVDIEKLARLLWRSEALELLKPYDIPNSILKKSRHYLYEQIASHCNLLELREYVLCSLKARPYWRDLQLSS